MAYEVGDPNCCILEICCGGAHQVEALTKYLVEYVPGVKEAEAKRIAAWLIETYDFAPAGTLKSFKRAISELARKYPPEPGY